MERNEIIIGLIDERLQELVEGMPHLTEEECEEYALLYLEREEQIRK
jgi:hypothetical protein